MNCKHPGCEYRAEANIDYCRGHEGGFTAPFKGRTEADSRAWKVEVALKRSVLVLEDALHFLRALGPANPGPIEQAYVETAVASCQAAIKQAHRALEGD